MITLTATLPCDSPPTWAFLERSLIDTMNRAIDPFLDRYVHRGRRARWRADLARGRHRLARRGGRLSTRAPTTGRCSTCSAATRALLHHGQRLWDGITRQLTRAGMVQKREYELGYDQFHQGESYIYFYFLCLADPGNRDSTASVQSALPDFYTGDDPDAPNYDPERKLIRAAHNGSGGPRWGRGLEGKPPSYGWSAGMRPYGLPYEDVPGVNHYDDLKDPELARRMGEAMEERMGRGRRGGQPDCNQPRDQRLSADGRRALPRVGL